MGKQFRLNVKIAMSNFFIIFRLFLNVNESSVGNYVAKTFVVLITNKGNNNETNLGSVVHFDSI